MKGVIITNLILTIVVIAMFSYCINRDIICKVQPQATAAPQDEIFTQGQLLMPDMVHSDTLVVLNADSLNIAFSVPATAPATDAEIFETLNEYCEVLNGHECKWPNCPYKGITASNFKKEVLLHTGAEDGSNEVAIDMLHLLNPSLEYNAIALMIQED